MSRVLVADDEPALLDSYCEIVAALGHEVLRAEDGEEALTLARKEHPDLVVTDYMMPVRTGVEVIRALRADPALARVPVVLVSAGRPPREERNEAWLFLSKPVAIDRLEAAVRAGLEESANAGGPAGVRALPDAAAAPLGDAREEMLGWVAHEIKSPLSAAMAAAQLAARGLATGEGVESIEKRLKSIQRQLARMNELVNTLLDAAQLRDRKLSLDRQIVDVGRLVGEAVAYWRDLHPEVQIAFADGASLELEADPARLRQIMDNLLSNAIKYGKPANQVDVEVRADPTAVVIRVVDRGAGIAPAEIPRLFDRFHRVAGQGGHGHGLGLYITAALARLHGGTVEASSQIGVGSTFTLTLPRKKV